MFRANRYIIGGVALFVTTLFFSFSAGQISPRLQKKINAAINLTYGVETFELKKIVVQTDLDRTTPVALGGDNLFEIRQETTLIGYVYLGEAPSMKSVFDYIVLFDPDFTIKKSKVLIYREDYGQQIGSQRWLKQFIGLSINDTPVYGQNIDAISGATVSASNMTRAVDYVLKSINLLKEKKWIK